MTKTLDPNAPVTRLPSFVIVPDLNNITEADFSAFPSLTQDQIDAINEDNLLEGTVIYNVTYGVYMGWGNGRWNNFNSSLTYKGGGYEVGSPFALPYGPASAIESNEFNQDPGVMYIDSGVNNAGPEVPKIFANDQWNELALGGGSSTFTDITVTGTATIANTIITDSNTINSTITVATIIDANIVTETVGNSTITNAVIGNATLTGLHVTGNAFIDGIASIGNVRAGITPLVGATTPGAISGLSGANNAANITVALGTAAGTGATATIGGSPVAGVFRLTTGTGCSGFIVADFTLPSYLWAAFSADFAVMWQHSDPVTYAADFTAKISAFPTVLGTANTPPMFRVISGGGAQLADSTSYQWNYIIAGNVAPGN